MYIYLQTDDCINRQLTSSQRLFTTCLR